MSNYELIIITVILRCGGGLRDGWSAARVKWLPWHLIGWLCRDLIIARIVWHFFGAPYKTFTALACWIGVILANFLLHTLFYTLGEKTIKWFPSYAVYVHRKPNL